jgi:gallate decarboxylase subunit D
METDRLKVKRFRVDDDEGPAQLEAVSVACGHDLILVVGGGEKHHIGATALSLSMPSLKNPEVLTNSSYLVPVPGHKEENLARDGSLRLSRALKRNVVVTVGIHDERITKHGIKRYLELFDRLLEDVIRAEQAVGG